MPTASIPARSAMATPAAMPGGRPRAGRRGGDRSHPGHRWNRNAGRRALCAYEPRQLGHAGAERAREHGRVPLARVGADDLDPRPEGRRAVAVPAARPEHLDAGCRRVPGQLVDETSLADARLTANQDEPAPPGGRLGERAPELDEVPIAA